MWGCLINCLIINSVFISKRITEKEGDLRIVPGILSGANILQPWERQVHN